MEINFLEKQKEEEQTHRPPRTKKIFFLGVLLLVLLGGALVVNRLQHAKNPSFFSVFRGFGVADDVVIRGERDDRINILLLGMGGEGHEGSYLTDTIILVSFRPSTQDIALLSLPRDLSIPLENGEWRKINSVNALAEARATGSGGETTRATIARLLNLSIPYHVRVDFNGFQEFIDDIGGVRVLVENRLEDPRYPILGKELVYPIEERYEHVTIDPGWRTMDGALALKYVRSRRALGIEGSDFARIKRQQNILLALKEKLFSWPTLVNPIRMSRLLNDLNRHIETNLTLTDLMRFADLARGVEPERVRRVTLSDAEGGYLVARKINDAYLLLPTDGTFTELRTLARDLLAPKKEATAPDGTDAPQYAVTVLNGTTIPGLARTIADLLQAQGFEVLDVGNAPERPVKQTELYDLTDGRAPEQERRIQLFLDALVQKETMLPLVATVEAAKRHPDFVIILGENARIPTE